MGRGVCFIDKGEVSPLPSPLPARASRGEGTEALVIALLPKSFNLWSCFHHNTLNRMAVARALPFSERL
jgi:hypothetical protein